MGSDKITMIIQGQNVEAEVVSVAVKSYTPDLKGYAQNMQDLAEKAQKQGDWQMSALCTYAAKTATEFNSKFVDGQLEKSLSELVESAFREGYSLGYFDGNSDGQSYSGRPCRDDDGQWESSDSFEALAKLNKQSGE